MSTTCRGRLTTRALAAAAFWILVLGCGRTSRSTGAPRAAADTARGIVQVVGAMPNAVLVLAPLPGTPGDALALTGPDSTRLRLLTGLDVLVSGTRSGSVVGPAPRPIPSFRVSHFVVRAANGVAAYDGVVVLDGDRYYLMTAEGVRLGAPHLPPALRPHVGGRVFLVGPLGAAPVAYGLIGER